MYSGFHEKKKKKCVSLKRCSQIDLHASEENKNCQSNSLSSPFFSPSSLLLSFLPSCPASLPPSCLSSTPLSEMRVSQEAFPLTGFISSSVCFRDSYPQRAHCPLDFSLSVPFFPRYSSRHSVAADRLPIDHN